MRTRSALSTVLKELSRAFKPKARPRPAGQAAGERQQHEAHLVGPDGPRRQRGVFDDADVVLLEAAGDVGLLHPLEHGLVEGAIRVALADHHVVRDGELAERERGLLLLAQRLLELLLRADGGLVGGDDAAGGAGDFRRQAGLQTGQLAFRLDQLRILCEVALAQRRDRCFLAPRCSA